MPKKHENDEEQRGLGELVYATDPEAEKRHEKEAARESKEVDEASKESFPASDPPEFTGSTADSGE